MVEPPHQRAFVAGMDLAGLLASGLHQNAVIRSLEVIGEAAGKASADVRDAHPELPWRPITAFRHRLIHRYADVRLALVWSVVQKHLAPLIAALTPLLPSVGDTAEKPPETE